MNKKMRELKALIFNKKEEARKLADDNKIEDAKALITEIRELEDKFEVESELLNTTKANIENNNVKPEEYNADIFAKIVRGNKLNDVENSMLTTGSSGENLLIPKDVSTKILELKRQYKSARDLIGYYKTVTLEGSYPIESLDTLAELINFTESDDVPDSQNPKFTNVDYKIQEYGGILPLSNTFLKNETAGIVEYLSRWFAKKAVRTENTLIFKKLKEGKPVVTINKIDDILKIINVDLDPQISANSVIVTNQDGFHYMDLLEDLNGRKLLEPNPINPTKRMFKGHNIEVFSNAELPTNKDKIPFFIGDLKEGADFVDRESLEFAMSSEAGFKQNKTYIRVIEGFDITSKDKSAYVYGEISPPEDFYVDEEILDKA